MESLDLTRRDRQDARDWRRRLPVVGWWFARTQREAREHGFWLRAALVEIVTGLLFAWLYLIEVEHDLPRWLMAPAMLPPAALLSENVPLVLHLRYTGHLLLVSLMLVASLIDYDEQLIPDALTVCGTLAALVLATVYPWSLLPAGDWLVNGARAVEFITLASPLEWPAALGGWPQAWGLEVALGCWTLWYVALLPRYWNVSRGWSVALRRLARRLRRERSTCTLSAMWLAGGAAIAAAAWLAPVASWAALVSALVGMAVGALLVWVVRVVAGLALRARRWVLATSRCWPRSARFSAGRRPWSCSSWRRWPVPSSASGSFSYAARTKCLMGRFCAWRRW